MTILQDQAGGTIAAQYAGASISLFSVFLGWFALKPLFETFGLTTIANLTDWLLVGAVVVRYGSLQVPCIGAATPHLA